jgi:hypothetical protein
MVNVTKIGLIWVTTTTGVAALACTRLPISTSRRPVMPSIGEVIEQ